MVTGMGRFLVLAVVLAIYTAGSGGAWAADSACSLLGASDIAKATTFSVGAGKAGAPVPNTSAQCVWTVTAYTKVLVVVSSAKQMDPTIQAQRQTGGSIISGLGETAVGISADAYTGGGYSISVVDSQGAFGVSILGPGGTRDRVLSLARVIEKQRGTANGPEQETGSSY